MALFENFSTIVAEIGGGLVKHRNERILISDVTREIRLGALKNSQVRVSVPSRSRSRAVNVETYIGTYLGTLQLYSTPSFARLTSTSASTGTVSFRMQSRVGCL
jgi:hypothetical protein